MHNPCTTKGNGMFLPVLVIMACTSSLFAQDITVSKDSLWVYNSNVSSIADQVIFTSSSPAPINLDSARIAVAEMDTAGLGYIPPEHCLEVAWKAGSFPYPYFTWTMDSVGAREFVLKKENFLPPEALPLSFTKSGDTARICLFSIGLCFNCSSLPRYPAYFRGTLKLFFSNSQLVTIRLYSDDLREKTSARMIKRETSIIFLNANSIRGVYSINGRKTIPATSIRFGTGVFIAQEQTGKCKPFLAGTVNRP
jgi:hypothetical protein